jgi:hypothetical protein
MFLKTMLSKSNLPKIIILFFQKHPVFSTKTGKTYSARFTIFILMMNSSQEPLASIGAFLRLIVVACWSIAQLAAWGITSIVGDLYAIAEACRAMEVQKSDMSSVYNALNYPDEVAPIA